MKGYLYYLPAIFVLALAAVILLTSKAFAYESPAFPSCINTSGLQLVVTFGPNNEGSLYKTSDDTFLRCYCTGDAGLQTNLWRIPQLSSDELAYFQNDGWSVIPNGSDVGLDEGKYLTKNIEFNCKDCITPTPVVASPSATPTPIESGPTFVPSLTPTPTAGQSGETKNESQPQVQGVSFVKTETPPTLATTGTTGEILLSLITGVSGLTGSIFLKRKRS